MSERQLILLIAGCLMLQPLSTDLYLASLPRLGEAFSAPKILVQQTLVFFSVGFGLAQLLGGPLSDRFGRRRVMLGGLSLYLLASLACALAPSIDLLIAARFAQACGCCAAIVAARALIRDLYSPAIGAAKLAQASSYMAFAVVSGPVIGAQLQVHFGWQAAFIFLSCIVPLLLALAWRWQEAPLARSSGQATGYRSLLTHPVFRSYALAGTLSYSNIFVFISGSSFVLIELLGVSTGNYGYCFASGCAGYLAGAFLCRRLLVALGTERTLLAGSTVMALAGVAFLVCCLAGVMNWWLLVAFQCLSMFSHGIIFPCAQIGSLAPFPGSAGRAAGLFGAISMTGALTISNLVGLLLNSSVLPLALLAAITGTLQWTLLRHSQRKRTLYLEH